MKAMVLGAEGMLGSDLVPIWRKRMEVSAFSHRQCDVSDVSAVNAAIEMEKPDVVLMLAAATDVDRCQTDHEYAFRTNSIGTEIVAQACARWKAAMVYISSIAVFSGEKDSPYNEYDMPSPCNVYGLSKLHGEKAVRTFCPRHWIVRTGWLFGGGEKDMKFVARILRKISSDDEIRVVRDCVGSPTGTMDLSRGIIELVERFQYGTYHLVNSGVPASRYELAIETLKTAGYPPDMVLPCLSSDFDLPAPRPKMEAAGSLKLGNTNNGLELADWRESLSKYIRGTLKALMQ